MFQARGSALLLQPTQSTRSDLVSQDLQFRLPSRVRFANTAPFASLSLGPRTEPATGLAFPGDICFVKTKDCPQLTGLGVRSKRLLGIKNINVYAVGLYVDPAAAMSALSKYKGLPISTVAANQAVFDELAAAGNVEKTLRLVISFGGLKRGQFLGALKERLAPACEKGGEASAMDQFTRLFDDVNFHKGLEIDFCQTDGGKLLTRIGGQAKPAIQSPVLSKALFDLYIGSDPVSPDAKESFGQGLAKLLSEK